MRRGVPRVSHFRGTTQSILRQDLICLDKAQGMGKDNHGTITPMAEDLNELVWESPFIQWEASLDSRATTKKA